MTTSITINQENFKDVSSVTRDIHPCFIAKADNGSTYSLIIKVDEQANQGQIGICSGRYNGLNRIYALHDIGSWHAKKILADINEGVSELTYSWSEALDYFATKYNTKLSISSLS